MAYIDNKRIKTVCIVDVLNYKTSEYLSNHCWIKTDKLKGITKGSKISFIATVEAYYKLYKGERVKDYQLINVKFVKVL